MDSSTKVTLRGAILATLGLAGLITVAAVAPNALQLLGVVKKYRYYRQKKYQVNQTLKNLQARKLIVFKKNHQGQNCISLTPLGRAELQKYQLQELKLKQPKHWDGKYRLVMFDIKEWKRIKRDYLRRWLEHLGFIRLQDSVWVYPHDCQEVIVLLKSFFGLGREVIYAAVDSLSNDRWLRRELGL